MATLTFGPEWLRNLTGSGSSGAGVSSSGAVASSTAAASSSASVGSGAPDVPAYSSNPATRYKQAERRYGREEMLAHYQPTSDIPVGVQDMPSIMCVIGQLPLALEPMSKDEQNLLLQCVNSLPMMRTSGRGTNSGRGGRGEFDRGRGRGRGREEDGLGKLRNRDNWDERGPKGFDRGFSMYGVEDGGPLGASPREVSRSISTESWRDNRQHLNEEELDLRKPERDRWYDVSKDRYGPKNWREPRGDHGDRHEFDDFRQGRPPTEAIRKIEYKRSRSSGSASFDDEAFQNALPEWSTTNPQEVENVGTFDSSGAFLPVKETSVAKSTSDAAPVSVKDANGKPSSDTSPDVSPTPSSNALGLSLSNVQRVPLMKDSGPLNSREVANGLATSSPSSASLSPIQPPLRLDSGGLSFQQLPIDSVNNRTVDGAVSEMAAAALQRQNGAAAGVALESNFRQTTHVTAGAGGVPAGGSLTMDSLSRPNAEQAATSVVDFVSKWTAENEANLLGKASPVEMLKGDLSNDQWFYRDPQGDIQGPFSNAEMNDWLRTGYFTMSLLVRHGYEGDFYRLGEMIKTLGYVPFDRRPVAVSTVYNNPLVPVAPVVSAFSQQHQLQQQLQQKQQLEQLRKMQHQQLLAMQQQHQGLLQPDYVRHIQMLHQQQLQQFQLQQAQQSQPRLPQLHVQDGFGLMMPPHDPLLGAATSALPLGGIHPAALTSSSELYAHLLQPPMSNQAAGCIPTTVPATSSIPLSRTEATVSSNLETESPTTVEQIEQLQFLELEKEREDRRMVEIQRLDSERLEEERRLQARIVDEFRQQKVEDMRRVDFERKQLEEERRKLEQLQRQVEQDRLLMEQKKQADKLENERKLREKLEEERLEKERVENERSQMARMEEERLKLEQKKQEEQRRREAEAKKKQVELEAKQKAEAEKRQKAEAETKQRAEAEARKRAEAEARQREEAEARQKEEAERRAQLQAQPPAKAPWSNNGKASKGSNSNTMTLAQIQEVERMQQAEESLRHLEQQRAAAAASVAAEQSKQTALTWTAKRAQPPAKAVPSLAEIQQEQAKQLQDGGHNEKSHLLSVKVAESAPIAASSAWMGGAPPAQWNKGGGGIWQTQEPIGKKKASVPASDNNSQFPALGASASAHPAKKASAKAEKVVTKTKKEEASVQKLFEVTKVRDDLTAWCEEVLGGLRTSVDIPTLVDLLKDIDSPEEVTEYARMYLGESKQVKDFTQQFLERRNKLRGTVQKQKLEDNFWVPSSQSVASQPSGGAGVNRQLQQPRPAAGAGGGGAAAAAQKPVVQDCGDKSKGGKKGKKKMQKIDSSILGFNVCAAPERTNIGEIDKV